MRLSALPIAKVMPRKRKNKLAAENETTSRHEGMSDRELALHHLKDAFASNLEPDVVETIFAECDGNMDAAMDALFVLVGEKSQEQPLFWDKRDHKVIQDMDSRHLEPVLVADNPTDFQWVVKPLKKEETSYASFNNFSNDRIKVASQIEPNFLQSNCKINNSSIWDCATTASSREPIPTYIPEKCATSEEQCTCREISSIHDDTVFEQVPSSELEVTDNHKSICEKVFVSTINPVHVTTAESKYRFNSFKSSSDFELFLHSKTSSSHWTSDITTGSADQVMSTSQADFSVSSSSLTVPHISSSQPYFYVPSFPSLQSPRLPSCSKNSTLLSPSSSNLNLPSLPTKDIFTVATKSSKDKLISKEDANSTSCDNLFPPSIKAVIKKIQHGDLVLVLLRGLPGSGKSTLASQLQHHGLIFSTDHYFVDKGKYSFDLSRLHEAHEWNKKRTKAAMINECTPIIIDNTNVELWEMKAYVELAIQYKYYIEIIEPNTSWKCKPKELAKRNQHGVSKEKIKKMIERYQFNATVNGILQSKEPINKLYSISPDKTKANGVHEKAVKIDDTENQGSVGKTVNDSRDLIHSDNLSNDITKGTKVNVNLFSEVADNYTCINTKSEIHIIEKCLAKSIRIDGKINCNEDILDSDKMDENQFSKDFSPHFENLSNTEENFSKVHIQRSSSNCSWSEVTDDNFDWNEVDDKETEISVNRNENPCLPEQVASFSPKPPRNERDEVHLEDIKLASQPTNINSPKRSKVQQRKNFKPKNKIAANFSFQSKGDEFHGNYTTSRNSEHNAVSSDELDFSPPLPEEMEELAQSLEALVLAKCTEMSSNDKEEEDDDTVSGNLQWDKILNRKNSNHSLSWNRENSTMQSNISFLKDCFPLITEDNLQVILQKCNNNIDLATSMAIESQSNIPESGSNKQNNQVLQPDKLFALSQSPSPLKSNEQKIYVENEKVNAESIASEVLAPDTCSYAAEPKEIMLHLDSSFAKLLEELFGPVQSCDDKLKFVVHLEKETARKIHQNWMNTQYRTIVHKGKTEDSPLNDENCCFHHEIKIGSVESKPGPSELLESQCNQCNIPELEENDYSGDISSIEDLELALHVYKKDSMKQSENRWFQVDLASKLKKQKLHDLYPQIDQTALDELLYANNFNLNDTIDLIKMTIGDLDDIYRTENEMLEIVKRESLKSMKVATRQDPIINVSSNEAKTDVSYENFRIKANYYYNLREVYFNKAKEAYSKGMKPVAMFYSDQARAYSEKMWEANENASIKILLYFNKIIDKNTIDLHLLYVREALLVLEQFLYQKKEDLQQSKHSSLLLEIITGKGAHSVKNVPRLKKSVINYLECNNYRFIEKNPGLLQVTLTS